MRIIQSVLVTSEIEPKLEVSYFTRDASHNATDQARVVLRGDVSAAVAALFAAVGVLLDAREAEMQDPGALGARVTAASAAQESMRLAEQGRAEAEARAGAAVAQMEAAQAELTRLNAEIAAKTPGTR
jgi:hypothetical protein